MRRKSIVILLTLSLLFTLAVPALAAKIIINGQQLNVSTTSENNTTLVPLRSIFQALDATVTWNNTTKTVTAVKGNITIKLKIGSKIVDINGHKKTIQVPSKIVNSKTMVPLRFVSEALGASVDWDHATQTININSTGVQLQPSRFINVKYPPKSLTQAIGDGITDDAPAIQSCINHVSSIGGGIVFLPKGNYLITRQLLMKENVTLMGVGSESTISCNFTVEKPYAIGNNKDIQIKNVCLTKFKLDKSRANTHGIMLCNIDGLIINKIEVYARPNALFPSGAGAIAISSVNVYASKPCNNIRITENHIENSGNYGIQVGHATNITIADNTFKDCYREVIGIEPYNIDNERGIVINASISGNTIKTGKVTPNGTVTGLIIITENSGGVARKISIAGNKISEYGFSGSGNPGINIAGGADITIIGNTINNLGGDGICSSFVSGSLTSGHVNYGKVTRRVTISKNKIYNCGLLYNLKNPSQTYSGIKLRDIKDSLIANNIIEGTKHYYGIEEIGTSKNNLIYSNKLINNINNVIYTKNF